MQNNAKQLIRMIRFISETKQGNYPNSVTFAERLRKMDQEENLNIACSAKTVEREIRSLKHDFHAPLEFDRVRNGYYLRYPDWQFECPVLCEDFITMSLVGMQLADGILPQPEKRKLRQAVAQQLSMNDSGLMNGAFLETLLMASGVKAEIPPKIFETVFTAWRDKQLLELDYRGKDDRISHRLFEPHIVAFHRGCWYAKGYQRPEKAVKVLALQRITSAKFGLDDFIPDRELLMQTRKNGLFNYERIPGIRLRCASSIAFYLREHHSVKKFKMEQQPDGSVIIELQPAIEHEVIRWVLGEAGRIEVLAPLVLREKIAAAGAEIARINS
ncbi:MAG: WYL domain-containing protein [Victivallis sp.]